METTTVVLLPGTGSDASFVEGAFGDAMADLGWSLRVIQPEPADVVGGYVRALDHVRGAVRGDLIVGGVSLGAAVAARWALDRRGAAQGAVLAMPAWTGSPGDSPAAVGAAATAATLRAHGLDASVAAMAQSSPRWLAEALTRSWRAQWPQLPTALDDAARYVAPTLDDLRSLAVPVGVVAAIDDPVHPLGVAQDWCAALPTAHLDTFALGVLAASPGELGRLGVTAFRRATGGS
jgi:pimeloyl-ACP methyl ester carboxylesterase